MLRDDLAEARRAWLAEAVGDPQEYAQRQESDFLADTNHEGELLDFHALRHTCGAWLARTGAHPKVVQQVMRHSTITLTMDRSGGGKLGGSCAAPGAARNTRNGAKWCERVRDTRQQGSAKEFT
jgi:integrase